MKRRLALKRLSASDLTLFECHYRTTPGAKQKAFNLDRAIFIDQLYPGLPDRLDIAKDRLPLDLSIYGPGTAGLHNLQRKVLKQQKNWRLNGELIYSPENDSGRYLPLVKGDFAIIEFIGDTEPQSARMCLVAAAVSEDSDLHKLLNERYGSELSPHKAMVPVSDEVVESVSLVEDHPVRDFIEFDILEDAVLGGAESTKQLRRRRKARGVGREEFERARKSAERTGRLGEELLNAWFDHEKEKGGIPGFRWESDVNAIAPYDFLLLEGENILRSIDAKSTSGGFDNRIHISVGELEEMAFGERPYDIFRLYSVKDAYARCRIAKNVGKFAQTILDSLSGLQEGVFIDGVSIEPCRLPFGDEFVIDLNVDITNQVRQQNLFNE